MKNLMDNVLQWLNQGNDIILASIIGDSGSAPRKTGSWMAIKEDGDFAGTIGGGAVEYKVQQMAAELFKSKESRIKHFSLSPNDRDELGMICGGNVTVYIQYISSTDEIAQELFAHGANLILKNTDSWLVTDITEETNWRMTILTADEIIGSPLPEDITEQVLVTRRSKQFENTGRKYYSKPLTMAERVFVFGGGHISRELVPLLSHLGFSCFVIDSLPEFANIELFPSAQGVILSDFDNLPASIDITERDFVVVMTRGHTYDLSVEAQVLKLKPRYLGVIGSRSKIAITSQKLLSLGYTQSEIDSIHTPIGIDIKANTPAEIAVSIAAELIMIRAG